MGFGLSVARNIVKLHSRGIDIASLPEVGRLLLPCYSITKGDEDS